MISFKLFLESQRRLQERRTIPLDLSNPIEKNFESRLDKDYDFADNIIRWYKNSKREGMSSSELISIYKTNLDNLIDLLDEYSNCVKKIRSAGKKQLKVNVKTRQGTKPYGINDINEFNFLDVAQNFIKAVCDEAAKLSTVSTRKAKYQITNEDAKKIRLLDFSNNVALWMTEGPGRDTTNKLVYQLWQNVKDADSKMNRGDAYGDSDDFSPYCTHSELHWSAYEKMAFPRKNHVYQQFWYFKKLPNVEYVKGDLTNKKVQEIFLKMTGRGPEDLLGMNDSLNDLLDTKDNRTEYSKLKFGNEIKHLEDKNFEVTDDVKILKVIYRGKNIKTSKVFSEDRFKTRMFLKGQVPEEYKNQDAEDRLNVNDFSETFVGNIRVEHEGWDTFLEKAKNLKTIDGTFTCVDEKMESLKGCPEHITGDFYFSWCDSLRSLEDGPKIVDGNFICTGNKRLSSLKGMSDVKIGKSIDCSGCTYLESLEGAPKIVNGDFDCSSCTYLKTLENCPEIVKGDFDCSYCENLENLHGSPKRVEGYFDCKSCWRIKSLKGSPEYVGGDFDCSENDYLKSFDDKPKYIGGEFIEPKKEDSYY